MKLMYIAGPYRAGDEDGVKYNIKQAENLGIRLVQEYNDWYPVIPPYEHRVMGFQR